MQLVALCLLGCGGSTPEAENVQDHTQQATATGKPIQVSADLPAASVSAASILSQARQSISRGDIEQAQTLLGQVLLVDPENVVALETLGDLAVRQGDVQRSIDFYRDAVALRPAPPESLMDKLAQQLMMSGQAFETIRIQQKLIDQNPGSIQTRFELAGLATMLGLDRIATEQLRWLAMHNQGHQESLIVLSQPSQVQPDGEMCAELLRRCPTDQRAQYGLAKLDAMQMKWQSVAERLQAVVDAYPEFVPAVALYGRAIVELGDAASIGQWSARLPEGIDESPTYWLAAGLWANRQGNPAMAAQAFSQAAFLDGGNDGETLTQLQIALKDIDHDQEAAVVSRRNVKLAELHDATKTLYERETQSQQAAMQVANVMLSLGRIWEAEGWARLAVGLTQDPVPNIRNDYLAIRSQLKASTPWQVPDAEFIASVTNTERPRMVWDLDTGPAVAANLSLSPTHSLQAQYSFVDRSSELGLVHTTQVAESAADEGHWIFQSNGGGGAAFDFDHDGWPDIALAVLDGQPLQDDSQPDRLYRNTGGRFEDVTRQSMFFNTGFTQGLTAGDYNDDGFTDLFVCNIGRNRLFRNNGDGTFTDVTLDAGLKGEFWTSSAAIADINDDGYADIFEVNYCAGMRPFEKPCRNRKTGKFASCTPVDFDAQPDHVWAGQGDGTFIEMSQSWLQPTTAGRGLGLVVGNLDAVHGMEVYVANDMTANHLWSQTLGDSKALLSDCGIARGVALSGQSMSQASMGIAVGDTDNDSDLDLFVTNFADEHNTFYEQVSPGMWVDHSYQSNLSAASMKLLGFGTQFIDIDNDSQLELVIANGHVSDVGRDDVSYRMPAQIFRQQTLRHWVEVDRNSLGDYFKAEHLGRALLTLDADCDGRTDLLVTHLFDPIALLMNETETLHTPQSGSANQIELYFVATVGQRDAIGTVVTATVGSSQRYAQLTCGDGYMASCERRVVLGTAAADSVQNVVVQWPSGTQQNLGDLPSGGSYLLIEGASTPHQLR